MFLKVLVMEEVFPGFTSFMLNNVYFCSNFSEARVLSISSWSWFYISDYFHAFHSCLQMLEQKKTFHQETTPHQLKQHKSDLKSFV